MKNPLNKRLPREFKKNAGKYIGIFIILVTTIVLGSSFMATMDSAVLTIEQNDVECKIEDGQFEVMEPVSQGIKEQFADKGVILTENYYSTVNDFDGDARVLVFNERTELNLPSLFEGSLPDAKDEIALERIFARNREIQVGDAITLNNLQFTVVGIMAVPDYNSLFKSNQDLLMNTEDFGISLVTKEGFARFDKNTLTYRYSYDFEDEDISKSEEKELIGEMQKALVLEGAMIQSFLPAENNQSITFLREDMGKDGPAMQVFIYILIVIIAFVFAILTNNTIESEATIIGTLRASGYKKKEIIAHYLSPTIVIAIVSSVIGNGLGYTVMLKPFENLYYSTYSIAPIDIRFNFEAFVTSTILPVVLMILINWFMIYRKLSLSPLKFLRKDLNKKRQKRAVKLPDFSFLTRFRIRVLLQNKINYLILFVGVFISSFLLMFGLGLQPLIDHYVEEIDDSLTYEYQYMLKAPVEVSKAEKLQVYSLKTWYELGKKDISVSFMGITEDSQFFEEIKLPEDEKAVTVSKPFADKMNVSEGDEIVFKDEYYDKEYTLYVEDVCDYKGSLTVFMERENLNAMLGYDSKAYSGYLSNEKLAIDDEYLAKIITRSDMVGAAGQMMKSFEGVLTIVSVFSVVIYMILMYILTKTVVEKNALAISFMKVFGYNSKEIGKLYLNATGIVVIASLVICIPAEVLCFKYILVYIGSMVEGYIPFYLPAWVYVAIIAIGIVSYFAINALHLRKVKRIPMSEALKNRE
ncbi:MAG: ABC transporter permease [Lachnospiraceae bacterium]|nr:ABC transporter permease [Lachnospiraceae bacterium]